MRYFREPDNVPSLGGRLIYNLQVEEKYDPVESLIMYTAPVEDK